MRQTVKGTISCLVSLFFLLLLFFIWRRRTFMWRRKFRHGFMKGKQKKIKSKNGKSHNVENFKVNYIVLRFPRASRTVWCKTNLKFQEDLNKAAKALQKSKNFLPWLDNAQLWIDENFTRLSNIFTAFADDWKEIPFEHFKAGTYLS